MTRHGWINLAVWLMMFTLSGAFIICIFVIIGRLIK